ncbi:hypothetical protein [Planktothricoides raciborskii]|uniref:Uncharacterized protein n=1 Tax=Planktothricoides raciborskii FACHB-1370 TaxID=2949576 RepID=A0ABR8EHV1_9CYAN|nr:hypothetical protein [Planktothricoides raciborskii]MBD2546446.1 hypothetical protein [Planktothricoides raciborskii FACHB-1370]MBD2584898.1 hypothetical protein [Planktothricoides raciborskii FACHB-1261]
MTGFTLIFSASNFCGHASPLQILCGLLADKSAVNCRRNPVSELGKMI